MSRHTKPRRTATSKTTPASRRPAAAAPGPTLSERKRQFVDAFMASGNMTQAAIVAGYSKNAAKQQGSRLMTKADIQQAIAERVRDDPAVWTREDRQRFWTAVASGSGSYQLAALRDRLKASELLGRTQADFVERHEIHAGGTLVDLLAQVTVRRT